MNIARWTTPSVRYKPEAVSISDIAVACLVVSQGPYAIVKDIQAAVVSDGKFFWELSQEETGGLVAGKSCQLQVDYMTASGQRYTTQKYLANVINSAINEELTT